MILPSKEFVDIFKSVSGALSVTESIAIMNIANMAPEGDAIELGTHRGKSALSALYGFSENMIFYLVDPDFLDKQVEANVAATIALMADAGKGKCGSVLIADVSENVIGRYEKYSYVFVDSGDHGEELVQTELRLLEDRVIPGGILAFHDYGNQFTAVARAYKYLVSTGKYEPIPIDWRAIIEYVRENDLENGNNSWHVYPEHPYPNFVGALKRK